MCGDMSHRWVFRKNFEFFWTLTKCSFNSIETHVRESVFFLLQKLLEKEGNQAFVSITKINSFSLCSPYHVDRLCFFCVSTELWKHYHDNLMVAFRMHFLTGLKNKVMRLLEYEEITIYFNTDHFSIKVLTSNIPTVVYCQNFKWTILINIWCNDLRKHNHITPYM